MAIGRYWLADKDAPYATVLNLLEAYFHPEIRDDNFQDLVLRARSADPEDIELATLKRELIRLLQGDRDGLHPKALATAAAYDQRSDDEFLQWLWHEVYPSEPVTASGTERGRND
ncbi:hypothetical protein [Kribbella karoonensis]|uniref:CdiI immunity protein domain-containing protein n=1 Tax=Kribbella karoonensis TaxID=324851 RepID=A0ABN2E1M1_9ACTN